MKVYLDVSCLNRPFDNQGQARIRLEAEAVLLILQMADRGELDHISSEMATVEIDAMPDADRRREVRLFLPSESSILKLTAVIWERAAKLTELGFKPADAAHVAAAESGAAEIFFTCDDKLLKVARRNRMLLAIRVVNPLDWIREDRNGAHA